MLSPLHAARSFFFLLASAAAALGQQTSAEDKAEYLSGYARIAETIVQIEQHSASPVERAKLFEAALRGVLAEVDPYSTYLPPDEYARLKRLARQAQPTVGLVLAIEQGRLVVLGVEPGSPADEAKILAGWRVSRIGGQPTRGLTIAEAEHRLAGGSVRLTVAPPGGEPRQVHLQAKGVVAPTVSTGPLLPNAVGYLRIASFGANTAGEVRQQLAALNSQGARRLVIDLRWNAGGLLQAAVDTADLLLSEGTIVSVASRHGPPRVMTAGADAAADGWPLAVLVNRYSASGSEVLAAALQDNRRGTIVGERTWGKGSVQSIIPLGDGRSAIKLTTAYYHRPSGKSIHRPATGSGADEWGVTPDDGYRVDVDAHRLQKLHEHWRSGPPTLNEDPQLARAINALSPETTP